MSSGEFAQVGPRSEALTRPYVENLGITPGEGGRDELSPEGGVPDPEVVALARTCAALGALADEGARRRVLDWARARFLSPSPHIPPGRVTS